ncbi:hypothetical protein LTR94_030559, partial [Friedmanniomyces endolithicus]
HLADRALGSVGGVDPVGARFARTLRHGGGCAGRAAVPRRCADRAGDAADAGRARRRGGGGAEGRDRRDRQPDRAGRFLPRRRNARRRAAAADQCQRDQASERGHAHGRTLQLQGRERRHRLGLCRPPVRRDRQAADRLHGPWRTAGVEQRQLVVPLEPGGVRGCGLRAGRGRFPRLDRVRTGIHRRDSQQLGRLAARGSAKGAGRGDREVRL